MTFYGVHVCRSKGTGFSYEALAEDWGRHLELLFSISNGLESLMELIRAIDDGAAPGKQLDWGAWVSPVRKSDLEQIAEAQGEVGLDPAVYRPFMPGKSDAAIRHTMGWDIGERVAQLSADEQYYLLGLEGV